MRDEVGEPPPHLKRSRKKKISSAKSGLKKCMKAVILKAKTIRFACLSILEGIQENDGVVEQAGTALKIISTHAADVGVEEPAKAIAAEIPSEEIEEQACSLGGPRWRLSRREPTGCIASGTDEAPPIIVQEVAAVDEILAEPASKKSVKKDGAKVNPHCLAVKEFDGLKDVGVCLAVEANNAERAAVGDASKKGDNGLASESEDKIEVGIQAVVPMQNIAPLHEELATVHSPDGIRVTIKKTNSPELQTSPGDLGQHIDGLGRLRDLLRCRCRYTNLAVRYTNLAVCEGINFPQKDKWLEHVASKNARDPVGIQASEFSVAEEDSRIIFILSCPAEIKNTPTEAEEVDAAREVLNSSQVGVGGLISKNYAEMDAVVHLQIEANEQGCNGSKKEKLEHPDAKYRGNKFNMQVQGWRDEGMEHSTYKVQHQLPVAMYYVAEAQSAVAQELEALSIALKTRIEDTRDEKKILKDLQIHQVSCLKVIEMAALIMLMFMGEHSKEIIEQLLKIKGENWISYNLQQLCYEREAVEHSPRSQLLEILFHKRNLKSVQLQQNAQAVQAHSCACTFKRKINRQTNMSQRWLTYIPGHDDFG